MKAGDGGGLELAGFGIKHTAVHPDHVHSMFGEHARAAPQFVAGE